MIKGPMRFLSLSLWLLVSCSSPAPELGHPILLFAGTGTSVNDVRAIANILENKKLAYTTVDSRQLGNLTESNLLKSQLLIIPGGDFVEIGKGLSQESVSKVRGAVQRGLNYLGICAGAILAGQEGDNSLNLTMGVPFEFYADVNRNIHKNVVTTSTAQGTSLDQYWEDGPQLNGWGNVVSKYPDGTAATVQGTFGKGHVILCGFHPEAPAAWRRGMHFTTSVESSQDYALTLINSLLHQRELPHY